jgi:hypothetical protein
MFPVCDKSVREVVKDGFRRYPQDSDRALKYIKGKLRQMQLTQSEINRALRK